MWNANLMQLGNFIDVLLAPHVSGSYAHHQEHWMLSCSIWFSAPRFWMGGGLESCCVGRVYGANGAVRHHPHRTHDPRSSSQDHHPSKNSVQETLCCNSASNTKISMREKCRLITLPCWHSALIFPSRFSLPFTLIIEGSQIISNNCSP